MSVHAISWVLKNSEARGGARLVMIVLADHANRDGGDSYPSVIVIAREARMSERSVQYALAALTKAGEITQTGVSEHGTRIWQITGMGEGADLAPPEMGTQSLHPNRTTTNDSGTSVSGFHSPTPSTNVVDFSKVDRATKGRAA